MQDVKHIIDGLKLRASYGTLGNQNLAGGDAASYYPPRRTSRWDKSR